MDLSTTSVFLDFDGTVTVEDTGVVVLERLAGQAWLEVEEGYAGGVIGSQECMQREWQLLPRDRRLVESVVRSVPLDGGFRPLVAYLRDGGAEVCVLSDGFGFYATEVAAAAGISVITNAVDWEAWKVTFPNAEPACECAVCGACKRAPIRAAKAGGRTTVLVGDGASDVKAATVADVVFAKEGLAEWCRANAVGYEPYDDLSEVQRRLAAMVGASEAWPVGT